MNNFTKWLPILVTLCATVGAAVFTPAFISAHPVVFAVLNGIAMCLHAALPSVFTSNTK